MPTKEEIVAALRFYNASQNTAKEAHRRFSEILSQLPPDSVVMHKLPGKPDNDETVYWTWYPKADPKHGFSYSAEKNDGGHKAIIVEAPAPSAELLNTEGLFKSC